MATVAEIVASLETFAPKRLAADWDNVGLLLGDGQATVQRIMTCLTVTPVSAAEAVAEKADLIVSHHPILFRAVQSLTTATAEGRMLLSLIRAGVAVHSPHTAFDNTSDGINELLAARLGMVDIVPLRRRDAIRQCKLVVFVPDADLSRVSDALFAAGAGQIGQYSECSFRQRGSGTFFGSEMTKPTVGKKGQREQVDEWRLEVVVPESKVMDVVKSLRAAHSYEEPAFDVYPLLPSADRCGDGRLGHLPTPRPLRELAAVVKHMLQAGSVGVVGDQARAVERVAIVCGAGGSLLPDAVRAGADALLTGELRFHDYLAAQADGLSLVVPGHYATERCGVEHLAEVLRRRWPGLQIWASGAECDPVSWV
jgi:dinuclear metal center YbgI/SA1388 family protein